MSFKQVTALRKSGEITAALELARRDYSIFVDHFSASALFWTLRVLCEDNLSFATICTKKSLSAA